MWKGKESKKWALNFDHANRPGPSFVCSRNDGKIFTFRGSKFSTRCAFAQKSTREKASSQRRLFVWHSELGQLNNDDSLTLQTGSEILDILKAWLLCPFSPRLYVCPIFLVAFSPGRLEEKNKEKVKWSI